MQATITQVQQCIVSVIDKLVNCVRMMSFVNIITGCTATAIVIVIDWLIIHFEAIFQASIHRDSSADS